jgi:hypothetical protein
MALPNPIVRLFRPETDAECIDRARKVVCFHEKYGRRAAMFRFALAFVLMAVAINFADFLFRVINPNPAMPNPANPAAWLGFSMGMLMGFFSGVAAFKGAHCLAQGIEYLRGERVYRLLLRYHDGLVAMMRNENDESATESAGRQPQGPESPAP